jgi:hypothetical protein
VKNERQNNAGIGDTQYLSRRHRYRWCYYLLFMDVVAMINNECSINLRNQRWLNMLVAKEMSDRKVDEFRKHVVEMYNLSLEDLTQVREGWMPLAGRLMTQHILDRIVEVDSVQPDIIINK